MKPLSNQNLKKASDHNFNKNVINFTFEYLINDKKAANLIELHELIYV